ncbi:hypothetical protein GEMRC1_003537 [Eukaryota sp. GEM-RC1]
MAAVKSKRGASLFSVVTNLTNTVVGAGVLTLPLAFRNASAGLAIILLVYVCISASLSMIFLAFCSALTGHYSYKRIAQEAYGLKVGAVSEIVVSITTCGTCTMFVVLLGDFSSFSNN